MSKNSWIEFASAESLALHFKYGVAGQDTQQPHQVITRLLSNVIVRIPSPSNYLYKKRNKTYNKTKRNNYHHYEIKLGIRVHQGTYSDISMSKGNAGS
ncbi:hypothetical protein FRX31_004536 [Thalictrum thalictroides]|uniref:Uncharacterized protein n=1 Tax=Thalictrum thalictroides TaxID=46969 RepID=A0A7J6XA67_THATH|nr:hypothetical protein FRX31_004536 [Thalictrum thalictroides]